MTDERVIYSSQEVGGAFGPCALAIGNFDGVHIGHQELLRRTVEAASGNDLTPAVLTFHPHPAAIVAPERVPEMLCTVEERVRLILSYGIRHVIVLPFTAELSRLSPRDFVEQHLLKSLQARHLLVGENFRFGHGQAGDAALLKQLGEQLGFQTSFLSAVSFRGEVVSSSAIRRHVRSNNVSRANRLLGRCFSVVGRVVGGQGIGSKETVPTLNQLPVPGLVTPLGIYVTETLERDTGRCWQSVTSVGTRPTFHGEGVTIETYLLDGLEGATPEHIDVRFRYFLRGEEYYPDAAALREQILRDVNRANAYWRRMKQFAGPRRAAQKS